MNTKLTKTLRRAFSLTAFTVLIATVTMAFADASDLRGQSEVRFQRGEPAVSHSPTKAVRLAEAPTTPKAPKAKTSGLTGQLNLNIATEVELTKLPGIGPKKAALIVQWRKSHGSFRRVVDLRRVKGFGPKSLKKLRPYLAVSGKNTLE